MAYEYKLPSLGDGVTGKVTDILVKPGDKVSKEQIVLVVGTDKVDAEMPVDVDGTILEILVKKGDEVGEGAAIFKIETSAGGEKPATPAPAPAATPAPAPAAPAPAKSTAVALKLSDLVKGVSGSGSITALKIKAGDTVTADQTIMEIATDKVDMEIPAGANGLVEAVMVKVGDEVDENTLVFRLATSAAPAVAAQPTPAAAAAQSATPVATSAAPAAAPPSAPKGSLRVSPLARKRAKELGVNLSDVTAAEGASRISYKDVVDYVKRKIDTGGGAAATVSGGIARKKLPNFEKFGSIERKPLSRIGVLTAENMHYAFNTIPHAWISEKADITRLEQLRQQHKDSVKAAGGNLTTTAIITKAICSVLRKMPQFNASLDDATNEVIYKKFINIGIAVDTPRGLLVPVIRNCDQKSLTEIAIDLTDISTRTRDGKNKPDDLDGGTFTISNIGGIGGTGMISIVNWPQVAILSIVAAQHEPVWNEASKTFEPRLMMPMTIGWDHRVINGADAARFLVELKKILEEPFLGWL
jgi:pyruvate dehydrogenase E2 component (dihydrolipoamide acetyltransferase)